MLLLLLLLLLLLSSPVLLCTLLAAHVAQVCLGNGAGGGSCTTGTAVAAWTSARKLQHCRLALDRASVLAGKPQLRRQTSPGS